MNLVCLVRANEFLVGTTDQEPADPFVWIGATVVHLIEHLQGIFVIRRNRPYPFPGDRDTSSFAGSKRNSQAVLDCAIAALKSSGEPPFAATSERVAVKPWHRQKGIVEAELSLIHISEPTRPY